MKLFLDTAHFDHIREIDAWGVLDGVTTNPAPLAAKAGANFIGPFLGKIDDTASDGMEILARCIEVVKNHEGFSSEILASSLRHSMHVVEAARLGSDIATMPYDVITKLVKHPLTDKGLQRFIDDWNEAREALEP